MKKKHYLGTNRPSSFQDDQSPVPGDPHTSDQHHHGTVRLWQFSYESLVI